MKYLTFPCFNHTSESDPGNELQRTKIQFRLCLLVNIELDETRAYILSFNSRATKYIVDSPLPYHTSLKRAVYTSRLL